MILSNAKRLFGIALFGGISLLCARCAPFYAWGYAPAIHPDATQAYIYAVMARERGDCETSLAYYDKALRKTRSEKVAAERKAVAAACAKH